MCVLFLIFRLFSLGGDMNTSEGPNELSFANVDYIEPILGTKGMPKGPRTSSPFHSLTLI